MYKLFFILILFLCASIAHAQDSPLSIKGTIVDEKGQAIEFATVGVKGQRASTSSGIDGRFDLASSKSFPLTLLISYIGYQKIELVLHTAPQPLKIQLEPIANTLATVEIVGRREQGYKNSNSFIGTKTATLLKDVPQSVGYVTKELLADQAAYTVNDAVKNISGVNQFSFYNDISIRGFRVSGQETSGNLLNGMREFSSFWKQQITPYLERVEIIKGPASALFGNASPGGTINRVTKKPLDETRQSLSTTFGGFNTFRALGDFSGPLAGNDKLLYRVNIGYDNSGSFRDLQFSKAVVVAPSFSFLPSDKTQLNLDVVYQNTKGRLDRGQAVFGDGDLYSVPVSLSLSAMNDHLNEESVNATVAFKHQFNKKLSLNATYMFSRYDEDLLEHRTSNKYASLGNGKQDPLRVEMRVYDRYRTWANNNVSTFVNWEFKTGELKHTFVGGFGFFKQQLLPGGSQIEAGGYLSKDRTKVLANYDPSKSELYALDANGNPIPNVAHFDLTSSSSNDLRDMSKYIYNKVTHYQKSNLHTYGLYIQDQIAWKKFSLLLGLRQDYYKDFINYGEDNQAVVTQQAFIPRLGLVYAVRPNMNLYATYVSGYQPQTATVINNPNAGGPFDPKKSRLYEAGLKSDWFSGMLSTTLSVYHLSQKGELYDANDSQNPDLMKQIGRESSKGFELDVAGKIGENWSVVAGYAYCRAQIEESANPNEIGLQKPNAPKHTFNMWSKYVFKQGLFKDFGIGAGANYVSERLGSIPAKGVYSLFPSYSLLNAAMYYKVDKFQLQVNVNNLLNKKHWVGGYDYLRAFPGEPRNVRFTVSYNM